LLIIVAVAGLVGPAQAQIGSLPMIDRELRADFPRVASMTAADLRLLQGDEKKPIILDVREPDEFAVSHLQGAIRVDPDAELDDILRSTGPDIKGRTIIFYCSVGVRSTALAERVRTGLKARGAARIVNLSEGIFGWHNANRPLVAGGKPTAFVHPYDKLWGRLLVRRDLVRYSAPSSRAVMAMLLYLGGMIAGIGAVLVIRRIKKA
jgi:rhodanese-related sulfurtransferase